MADITVSNFTEFLTAIATAGNTVICPENEVWDMSEIQPEGTGLITINCSEIKGNGLEIKNLVSQYGFWVTSAVKITDIAFTNVIANSGGMEYNTVFFGINGVGITLRNVTMSVLCASNIQHFFAAYSSPSMTMEFCAFNIEMPNASAVFCQDGTASLGITMTQKACRITVSLPNSTARQQINSIFGSCQNCEVVMYAPSVTWFQVNNFNSCTIRGNLSACTAISFETITSVSIYCTDDAPSAATSGAMLAGVTDSQMKDATYLRSIGFMIGDE